MAEANVDMIPFSGGAFVGKVVIVSNGETFTCLLDIAFDSGLRFGIVVVFGAVERL